jgi:hypothetical protein
MPLIATKPLAFAYRGQTLIFFEVFLEHRLANPYKVYESTHPDAEEPHKQPETCAAAEASIWHGAFQLGRSSRRKDHTERAFSDKTPDKIPDTPCD